MAKSVSSVDQKILVAITNKFLQESVSLLNSVCTCAEEKMMNIHRQMQRIEDSLAILEAKLNSVPDLSSPVNTDQSSSFEAPQTPVSQPPPSQDTVQAAEASSEETTAAPAPPTKTVAEDERFVKYFKMLKMGVPQQAVKNKMKAEGLDDSVLDNPDAPADVNIAVDNNDTDDDSGGDESDSWD